MKSQWFLTAIVAAIGLVVAASLSQGPGLLGQDDVEQRREDEHGGRRVKARELERELQRIEELVEEAEQDENEARVRALLREANEIRELLERSADREEDGEEAREHHGELHRHHMELETHRMELEVNRLEMEVRMIRMEAAERLAEMSSDPRTAAAMVIDMIVGHGDEEEATELLEDLLEETENETVARMLRVRLAPLYAEQEREEEAVETVRAIIIND